MIDVDGYLDRIGAARPAGPDLAGLRDLQERHLGTVPFENLGIHLGESVTLTGEALVDKVVRRRRGGFCYEVNGAFSALLTALGYRVSLMSAQAYGDDGEPGAPFGHLALLVELPEPWLVDVGFGRFSRYPIALADRAPQDDPEGVFRVVDVDPGVLDISWDDQPQYRVETRPRRFRDFEPTCWYQRTSPDSHFTRSLLCTVLTEGGRMTLAGTTLIHTDATGRTERELSEAEILPTYRDVFGITLDTVPTVRRMG